MGRIVRDGAGLLLVLVALGALYLGVTELRDGDYLAATLVLLSGFGVLRAGVELLRPSIGE